MTHYDFKNGTLVRLRGQKGSPIMTVSDSLIHGYSDGNVKVEFWKKDSHCFKEERFHPEILEKVSNEEIEAIEKIRKKNYDNPYFSESNDTPEAKADIENLKPIEKTIFEMIKQKFTW